MRGDVFGRCSGQDHPDVDCSRVAAGKKVNAELRDVTMTFILPLVRRIHDQRASSRPDFDVVGAALSAVGLGLVVFGILKISTWGLFKPTGALTIGGTKITPTLKAMNDTYRPAYVLIEDVAFQRMVLDQAWRFVVSHRFHLCSSDDRQYELL